MTDFKHYPLPAEGIELMKQYEALLDTHVIPDQYLGRYNDPFTFAPL